MKRRGKPIQCLFEICRLRAQEHSKVFRRLEETSGNNVEQEIRGLRRVGIRHVLARTRGIKAAIVRFSPSGAVPEGFVVDGDWIVRRTTTASERRARVRAT